MDATERFDVFLSHNSRDKPSVIELSEQLKERGLRVWLDVEELVPGRPFQPALERIIKKTGSAAILVGKDGLGPWEIPEMQACLQEFVTRSVPVIPVLLPSAPSRPELPLFLAAFTWVDLRGGITKAGVDRLVWGITGVKALETNRAVVVFRTKHQEQQQKPQYVDAWGIASVKSRLHALSEIVAQAASEEAALAAGTYKEDILSILVPIAFEMRWHRGYAHALERMLKIPRGKKRIRDFSWKEVPGGCAVSDGVLSARLEEGGRVLILLDNHPAIYVMDLRREQQKEVLDSVNLHGRLGLPSRGGLNLAERITEVPIRSAETVDDEMAAALYRNREVLAPLIARLGMPGSEWLLPEEEHFKHSTHTADRTLQHTRNSVDTVRAEVTNVSDAAVEVLDARNAINLPEGTPSRSGLRELLKSEVVRQLFGDLVDTNPEQVLEMIQSFSPPKA